MDGKGEKAKLSSTTDNICIERFSRSAKCEKIYLNEYNTIKELNQDVRDYIDFYRYRRFHQSIDYNKPMSFYNEYYGDLQEDMA